MKKIFLLMLIWSSFYNLFAINVKEKIAKTPIATIPFDCIKMAPWGKPGFSLSGSETGNLPMYAYLDLGLTLKTKDQPCAYIFRRFASSHASFEIFALNIGEYEQNRHVLATINKEGEIIDFIEASVYFITSARLFVKQWRIDTDQNIIITWLKINHTEPMMYVKDFNTVNAQRIDLYYKIDANGKFQLTKEVKYEPQSYTQTYLLDKTKNLWEGKETPLE